MGLLVRAWAGLSAVFREGCSSSDCLTNLIFLGGLSLKKKWSRVGNDGANPM